MTTVSIWRRCDWVKRLGFERMPRLVCLSLVYFHEYLLCRPENNTTHILQGAIPAQVEDWL